MKTHQALTCVASFGVMSCTASIHDQNHDRSGAHTMELAGKTVSHTWTQGPWAGASFVTFFCDHDTLVWNNVSDPDNVTSEQETYARSDIADSVVQISWKESPDTTNFGLVWTLNVHGGEITGVIVNASPVNNVNVSGGVFGHRWSGRGQITRSDRMSIMILPQNQ